MTHYFFLGTGFFKQKRQQANLPSKTTQNRDKRQTDIRYLLTPNNRKPLTVLSHNTPHKELTTLHTRQNCTMVI